MVLPLSALFLLNPIFVVMVTSKINCKCCANPALGICTSYTEFNLNQMKHKSKPNCGNACQEIKKRHQTSLKKIFNTEKIVKKCKISWF